MNNSLILVAAGSGRRMGAEKNKLLLVCEGHPVIYYTLKNILASKLLTELIIVTKAEERAIFERIASSIPHKVKILFADGGDERSDSVRNGLNRVSADSEKVLIHDGARPLVDGETIDQGFKLLSKEIPAVMVGIPSSDTVKEVENGLVIGTLDRSRLYRAQTPQGALTSIFKKAMCALSGKNYFTDDASIIESLGIPVRLISGKEQFFKVTTPEDLERLGQTLRGNVCPFRIGQGYDIHKFDINRPLYLGGIRISDTGGLKGHSDADVLLHAIMDALLGACGLYDIGHYFPDTDDKFANADSAELLAEVKKIIEQHGYQIGNIDSTVIAEKPKLASYISVIKERIADILDIQPSSIGIKATTNETLGPVGRKEGIVAIASAIVFRRI